MILRVKLLCGLAACVLVTAGWLLLGTSQGQQAVLGPPPSTPNLVLNAETITSWNDGAEKVYLLQGKTTIQQGTDTLRMDNALVWVDTSNKDLYRAIIYPYGKANIDLEGDKREAEDVFFLMSTTGDVRSNSFKDPILEKNLSGESNYQQIKAQRGQKKQVKLPIEPASTIQQVQQLTPIPSAEPLPGNLPPSVAPFPPPPTIQLEPPVLPPPMAKIPVPRRLSIRPRSAARIQFQTFPQKTGETIIVVPNGIILQITNPAEKIGVVDIEADRMVFWTSGNTQQVMNNLQSPAGESNQKLEFYLAGNVEIRSQIGKDTSTLRATEIYYDATDNSAIALKADLEIKDEKMGVPVHLQADEVRQLNPKLFQATNAQVYSTLLPSDPGFRLVVKEATIEQIERTKMGFFGNAIIDPATGQPQVVREHLFTGRNTILYYEQLPFFYVPYLKGRVEDPLGPLENVSVGVDRPFGFKVFTTWDMYQLFGLEPIEGTRWRLYLDYLARRGPFAGTSFDYKGTDAFGLGARYNGFLKAYGGQDDAFDILGGDRGERIFISPNASLPVNHPDWRGFVHHRGGIYDLPYGFTVQTQLAFISDRNFIEQYYFNNWLTDYNYETSLYVKQQQDFWAWSILAQPRLQNWITETQWLPKLDGYLQGMTFLDDWFVVNAKGSAAYAQMRVPDEATFAYNPTHVDTNLARFDIAGDVSLPFNLGFVRMNPYVKGQADHYTQDLQGQPFTRLYGGAGLSSSVSVSQLFENVDSDLLNLRTLYHKAEVRANAFVADSNARYNRFPMLDLLNDNASDQALRDIFPIQTNVNPQFGNMLKSSPLFDPQLYAIRRLVDNRFDTIDRMEVVQFETRQRLQTLRGLPGQEHVVDWMTLDIGASLFPNPNRDNFGEHWGIIEYDWLWNVGDRTALVANGWFEPIDNGPRMYNVGAYINRPDRTSLYLGYRQIDPLQSKAVIASISYQFSQKYSVTASTSYDFGVENQSFGFQLVRTGTDVQVLLGLNYNSIINSVGFQLEIVPTLIRPNRSDFGNAGVPGTIASGR